jgi:hypothetical protein
VLKADPQTADIVPMSIASSASLRRFACLAVIATALLSAITVTPASGGAKHVGPPVSCRVTDPWLAGERWHATFRLSNHRPTRRIIHGVWDVDGAPRYRTEPIHLRALVPPTGAVTIEEVFGRRQPVFTELRCGTDRQL